MSTVDRDALRRLVAESGRSARAISLDAKLGATAVKDILSGKSKDPGAKSLIAIAGQLGVTVSDLMASDEPHMGNTPDLPDQRHEDDAVQVELLPTFAGMGGGGTGEGDGGTVAFSRSLVEGELRTAPEHLLAVIAEGNSMEPEFCGGDQILIDRRRTSLAAPGAFCLWDSDGYVIKYLERIPGSDPPRVRIVSLRSDLYPPYERLVEECDIRGRVVWFGRRVP